VGAAWIEQMLLAGLLICWELPLPLLIEDMGYGWL